MLDVKPLALPRVLLITPRRHGDARGWFAETWSRAAYAQAGIDADFIQDNTAFNVAAGTVRGLHFQTAPHAQAKLVRCIAGAVFDVAVDVRPGSPTHGRWAGAELSAQTGAQLFVPRGFAHGYLTLTDAAEVAYKVDGAYAPDCEGGVRWDDPEIGVAWPRASSVVSDRDEALPPLRNLPSLSF